jgi:CheY-like chemotaxis protein
MQFGLIPKALCIANTGYADLETKRLAIAAGMDFYLTKPFEIKILEDYLKTKFPLNIEL